ncbi:right-handed parallel beta-helix repeat-containing protein [Microvirga solisilvae]|uniref:right-handed parallel beta-helix repeat-containing protein n=1 Tax=Microvirga solisilvae TaxID=2919498 RepID=UPI001FAF62AA|nr:right-handed parallel beta-helix repeat-containing protein [Microvirga solisilvae]
MIVSSRSDRWRRLLSGTVFSLLLSSVVWAQEVNEISRLAEEARQAFLSAEQGAAPKQKANFYQVALARIQLLEKFAGPENAGSGELRDGARAELNRLADDGLSHDMLGAMLLQASLGDMSTAQSNTDRMELGVTIHQIASEQRSPEYRVAAFIDIGFAYSKIGVQDRALRYATLALDAAKSISGAGEQSGAYNAVSRLATTLGQSGYSLADRAIGFIPRPRDRAYARQDLALAMLKGTQWQKAEKAQLDAEARKRLAAGDVRGSLSLALALGNGDQGEKLLSDILSAALKTQDYDTAIAASQGFFGSSDQEKALASIVTELVAKGIPLQSVSILETMQDGSAKITAQLAVASELARSGYEKMAEPLFDRAIQGAEASDKAAQAVVWPEVVRALTRADRLDQALLYTKRFETGSESSSALGDLAKRLADGNRIADAEALLPQVQEREDRSHALSGIGRAKAQAGDATSALHIGSELTDPEDAGRVLSAVVKAHSQSGKFSEATSLAGRIADKEHQVEAWVEISRQASKKKEGKVWEQAYNEAIRIAEAQQKLDRDKAYYTIVKSLADLGDKARAGELRQRIIDDKLRSRADEALAKADAKQAIEQKKRSNLPDAILKRSFAQSIDAEDKVEIALDLIGTPNGVILAADLIRSIKDDRVRGSAFRRLAEAQMAFLSESAKDQAEAGDAVETIPPEVSEESEIGRERRTRRGLSLASIENEATAAVRPPVPKSFPKASDIRATIAWPSGAIAGATFAKYNLYISKFLDEGPNGETRIEQAVRYQGLTTPRVIIVQSGITTLGMIARQLQGTQDRDLIAIDGDIVTLRAPVFVAPGASLILSRLDVGTYRFSANAGAFIANAGKLDVVDAEIVGYDEKAGQPAWSDKSKVHEFRPFLLSWGDGQMNVAGSVLTALGYENSKSYGLSYSSGPILVAELRDQAHATGYVVDNVFRNSHFGFYSYEAENVYIVGNEYVDNVIYGLDPHDRTRNLTIALNTTYGTMVKHGIIVSREVDDSIMVGNLTFDNVGSGIMLDRDSANNIIHANTSFNNVQDGITLFESSCNLMTNNYLLANKRDGLKVRNSFEIAAYSNRIEANGSAGVNAYVANLLETKSGETRDFKADPYDAVTSISLRRNRISANGVGISAQGASGLTMFSNTFVRQSRRLFGGDLRGLEGLVLQSSSKADTLIASTCRPVKPAISCHLRERGYFEGGADLHIFDPAGKSDCTAADGSVQQRAFSSTSQGT